MGITRKHGCTLYKTIVGSRRIGVCCGASVVEGSKNSRRAAFLDKIAYDLVVEIFDRCPFDLLPNILLLFCL
jgi:hypothetical protein